MKQREAAAFRPRRVLSHIYVIEFPPALDASNGGDGGERQAYLCQSFFEIYNVSIWRLRESQWKIHLRRLFECVAAPTPAAVFSKFVGCWFFNCPLEATRATRIYEKQELANVTRGILRASRFVHVDLYNFCLSPVDEHGMLTRTRALLAHCFRVRTLQSRVPFGWSYTSWNQVLNVMVDMSVAAEQHPSGRLLEGTFPINVIREDDEQVQAYLAQVKVSADAYARRIGTRRNATHIAWARCTPWERVRKAIQLSMAAHMLREHTRAPGRCGSNKRFDTSQNKGEGEEKSAEDVSLLVQSTAAAAAGEEEATTALAAMTSSPLWCRIMVYKNSRWRRRQL
jgi:hypothetical protein